jgi:hypothetical protein
MKTMMKLTALALFCVSLQFLITLVDSSSPTLLEGDIVAPKNRNGILAAKRWTNGIIPWEWSKDATWNQNHRDMLASVMREIEKYTCLRFVPNNNHANYIRIVNDSYSVDCYSSLGQVGGKQDLNLADNSATSGSGCWSNMLVMHEVLHAVGLGHEHTRYDREKYIKIYLGNVEKRIVSAFQVGWKNETDTYGVPYDYYSVMHYGKKSHSKNGRVTMQPTDIKYINVIGRQNSASENDFEKVRRIYQCRGSYPAVPAPPPPPPPSQADLHICEDELDYCDQQLGKCGKEDWTKTYCKRSCGFCSREDDCQDELDYCAQLLKECVTNQLTRETYCKKTCRFC